MTDIATALAPTNHLTPFEGLQVVSSGIEIPGAAGGLQPAMKIEPREFHQGDDVFVVFQCTVAKIRHEPIVRDEPSGAQRRVHVFQVAGATIIDADAVKDALDQQRLRIEKAREEAAGVQRIPGMEGWSDEETEALVAEHLDGQHASGLREGCPSCDEERQAEDDEVSE